MYSMKQIWMAVCASLTMAASASAADLVVVGHPGAAPMSKDQVADVYLGKSQSAVPWDLPEASPLRADFYKKATGRDLAQVKSVWSRVVFTGKGQPPKEAADATALKKAVAADPKAVGYIEKSAVDATVKVLWAVD